MLLIVTIIRISSLCDANSCRRFLYLHRRIFPVIAFSNYCHIDNPSLTKDPRHHVEKKNPIELLRNAMYRGKGQYLKLLKSFMCNLTSPYHRDV